MVSSCILVFCFAVLVDSFFGVQHSRAQVLVELDGTGLEQLNSGKSTCLDDIDIRTAALKIRKSSPL